MPRKKLAVKAKKTARPVKKAARTAKKTTVKKTIVKKTTARGTRKLSKKVAAPRTSKKRVTAIPKGYNSVTPYLIVDNADNAINFYKKAFAAKVVMRMEGPNGKVTHAELKMGDSKIMLADEWPECNAKSAKSFGGTPVGLHLYVKNADKVVERALAAGAKLIRQVENMFYGDRTGAIEDISGHMWHISTHIEDVSTREMKKRAAKFFAQKKQDESASSQESSYSNLEV